MRKVIVSRFKYLGLMAVVAALSVSGAARGIQVVTAKPNVACQSLTLHKELRVFKDPNTLDWENLMDEKPLTTRKGNVKLMQLTEYPLTSKTIAMLSRLYDQDHKQRDYDLSRVIPIKICGGATGIDAYSDTLGFVIEGELKDALVQEHDENMGMPPSTAGNPIPKYVPDLAERS